MSEDTDADDGFGSDSDAEEPPVEFDAPTDDHDADGGTDSDDKRSAVTDTTDDTDADDTDSTGGYGPPRHELRADIRELEDRLDEFESDVDSRTVKRSQVERDLRRYVRRRMRRGHARGWGPYLVLLYGTIMTLGAFYFLEGGWAVAAMLVIWLSTLGLYVMFVLFGTVLSLLNVPGRLYDRVSEWRSP